MRPIRTSRSKASSALTGLRRNAGAACRVFLLSCVAAGQPLAANDDWERIASETEEPDFALRIVSVTAGSQAEALGLRVGDYIYQIGESAMRAFSSQRRDEDAVLFYCRASGAKGTAILQPGLIGATFEEAFRPQIGYLREEFGTRAPGWDAVVVEALSNMQDQPELAEALWDRAKALSYPDDELDAFVRAYCGWRAGREIPLLATYDKIVEEFAVLPRLYAAALEDMAFASGETDILKRLHAMDPDSSQTPQAQIDAWESFDSSPLPARSTLDEALAKRGRDLREALSVVDEARVDNPDAYLNHLRRLTRFDIEPGRQSTIRFSIPDEVIDFHYSVSFRCVVPEHHEAYVSEARISVMIDAVDNDAENDPRESPSRHRTRLGIQSHRALGSVINLSSTHGDHRRRIQRPEIEVPVLSELPPGADPPAPAEFRLDIVRLGRELATFVDGVPYSRIPVDPAAANSDFSFFASGIDAKLTKFEIWSLATEANPSDLTRHAGAAPAPEVVADLRRRFDAAYLQAHQPLADLNRTYVEALQRLLDSETANGDLDAVMQVRREIEAFGDGSDYSAITFLSRAPRHRRTQDLRTTYLRERARHWNAARPARTALIAEYQRVYAAAEQEQTRLGNIDAALALRKTRETLESDPRFEPPPPEGAFLATVHFVAKGEALLMHNGTPIPYENAARDPRQYIDAAAAPILVAPGDVLLVLTSTVHARISFTTSPCTSVRRKCLPWYW